VYLLSAFGVACAAVIVAAEALGSPQRPWLWLVGGGALGAILVAYGVILLLLRKMGVVGPRRAER
jgi:hypothetical protein